jgi:hypothetical protein
MGVSVDTAAAPAEANPTSMRTSNGKTLDRTFFFMIVISDY